MPNALILEYQKSRIRHTPSHLHKWSRATRSLRPELVFNTDHAAVTTADTDTVTPKQTRSLTKPAKRWWGVVLMKICSKVRRTTKGANT
jgi:hypothetical protein